MSDLAIDQQPERWSDSAAGYDEASAFSGLFADDALRLADVGVGDRILDVAAGTGALSIRAAQRGAQVVATDFAPGMVAYLAQTAAEQGLDSLSTAVMDGQALDLDDDIFDGLDDAQLSAFGDTLTRNAREAQGDGPYAVEGEAHLAVGTKQQEGKANEAARIARRIPTLLTGAQPLVGRPTAQTSNF